MATHPKKTIKNRKFFSGTDEQIENELSRRAHNRRGRGRRKQVLPQPGGDVSMKEIREARRSKRMGTPEPGRDRPRETPAEKKNRVKAAVEEKIEAARAGHPAKVAKMNEGIAKRKADREKAKKNKEKK